MIRMVGLALVAFFFSNGIADAKTLFVRCKCGVFSMKNGVSKTSFFRFLESSADFDESSPELDQEVQRFTTLMRQSCENTLNLPMALTYDCQLSRQAFTGKSPSKKARIEARREAEVLEIERRTFIRYVENIPGCYHNPRCCSDCWSAEELERFRARGRFFP